MSRVGSSRIYKYNKQYFHIVCASCGEDDSWEGFEDVVRVAGQEGHKPEIVTVGGCACGHQQDVAKEAADTKK